MIVVSINGDGNYNNDDGHNGEADVDEGDDDDHPLNLPLPPLQLFSNCCQKQTRLPLTFLFPNIEDQD